MSTRLGMRRRDDGSIAPLLPVMAFVLLLLGGLVIDSARLLGNRSRAVAYAEEAARAGAASVDLGQRELGLDPDTVAQQVQAYCDGLRADLDTRSDVVDCGLDREGPGDDAIEQVSDEDGRRLVVRTRVTMKMRTTLLGMIGVQSLDSSGVGRARAFEGVDAEDVDSTPPPVSFEPVQPPADPPDDITAPSAPPELPPCPVVSPAPAPTQASPQPTRRPGQGPRPSRTQAPAPAPSPTCQPVTPTP